MIKVIRNPDRTIKTFVDNIREDDVLLPGETMEIVLNSFNEYANRLVLSCAGRSGETMRVARGAGEITVEVNCPGEVSVSLNINGTVETLPLINGKAALMLSSEVPGTFLIGPADRASYCAAGQAVLMVEVV